MPNGAIRQANLKMLFEKAKQFENASFKGLFNFINFIDRLKNNNGDLSSAKLIGENENVIRIMSIHKSKGLEFPVVFLCGTGKSFNMRDLNEDILLHQDMGIGPKLIDFERRIEYDTLAKEAIKLKIKLETLSEEQRILYVALTRAKEKLIITGISKDLEKDFKQKRELLQIYNENMNIIDYKLVKKYKTYLDWLELVYLKNENKITDIATLYTYTKTDLEKELNNKEQEKLNNIKEKIFENTKDLKDTENIKEILNWKYRYKKSSEIPTKTAVTRLQAEEDKKIELTEIPKFMGKEKKITPAEKGTLMHLCIQRLNEKQTYTKETIKQMIQSLVLKEIITTTEADAINIDTLYKYTKSALWNDLSKAKEIHKEQPFYINIPAKEIYEKELQSDDSRLGGLYNNLGLTLTDLKRFDEAEEYYNKAINVMSNNKNGELEIAITYLNLCDLNEAKLGSEQSEKIIDEYIEKAYELLNRDYLPRNGYYAFVCEKCAPTFGYFGRFLYQKELSDRARCIYERN